MDVRGNVFLEGEREGKAQLGGRVMVVEGGAVGPGGAGPVGSEGSAMWAAGGMHSSSPLEDQEAAAE